MYKTKRRLLITLELYFLPFFLTSAAAFALVEDEADNMVDFISGTTGGAALRGYRELYDRSSD